MKPEGGMTLALEQARKGVGLTHPNPPVGAVVCKGNRILGAGYHRRAGGPHAEVFALKEAGASAKGATLYVTLEPCSTQGRTPPCTEAVRAAGIKKVVVGCQDPNPKHAGRGLTLLRATGVEVVSGVCEDEARALIAPFTHLMLQGRPRVVLKLGMTLDGRIADRRGKSQWITSSAAREQVQALRRASDAVLVGAGTVCSDNPSLLPRPALGRTPWRVVLDGAGRVSPSAKLFTDGKASQTLVATTPDCSAARRKAWGKAGARVLVLTSKTPAARLRMLLKELGRMGCMQVLCEGGGELASGLVRAGLVDEFVWFIAPRLLGGDALPALSGKGWRMGSLPELCIESCQQVGPDLCVRAVPHRS